MAELALVVEEAEAELSALRELVAHSEAKVEGRFMLGAQARIAAANSLVLYLAAAFEEAVRQLGQAYVDALALKTAIPPDRLAAIRIGLWERSTKQLTENSYGTKEFNAEAAGLSIATLRDFCLEMNDIAIMRRGSVYNYRNMRTKEVNVVFKRLGVNELCNRVGRCNEFRAFFIVETVAKAQDQFILFLDEFYEIRNQATHELGTFRSQGAVDSDRLIDFFQITIRRMGTVLNADLDGF